MKIAKVMRLFKALSDEDKETFLEAVSDEEEDNTEDLEEVNDGTETEEVEEVNEGNKDETMNTETETEEDDNTEDLEEQVKSHKSDDETKWKDVFARLEKLEGLLKANEGKASKEANEEETENLKKIESIYN